MRSIGKDWFGYFKVTLVAALTMLGATSSLAAEEDPWEG